jgi:hypothetical protein
MTLDQIMLKYQTDKSSAHHDYCSIYEKFFHPIWEEELMLFVCGVGGYEYPDRGGGDLFAFAEYFPNAKIYAIDIYPKKLQPHPRINIYQCGQDDEKKLEELFKYIPQPDIIIDDASHNCEKTIRTFELLFPKLKDSGIWITEDAHCSYFDSEEYGGCADKGNKMHRHIHNYIDGQSGLNILHKDEKLIILRK